MSGFGFVAGRIIRPLAREFGEGLGEAIADTLGAGDSTRRRMRRTIGGACALGSGLAVSSLLACPAGLADTVADSANQFDS